MRNQHLPFELLEQIRFWVRKNIVNLTKGNEIEELKKIENLIAYYERRMLSNSDKFFKDLLKKQHELESIISVPNEDKIVFLELAEELSSLSKYIQRQIKPLGRTKAPSKRLRVILPDGEEICERKAVDTYIRVLQYMGLDRVAGVGIILQKHPAVSTQRDVRSGNQKFVDGFYVEVKTSTEYKAKLLQKYAEELGINIQIEVID